MGLLLLFVASALRVISIDDLGFWDEAGYLKLGTAQSLTRGEPFTQGGSYFDAYWIASRVVTDPVVTYYLMRILSAFILVLAIWIFARLFVRANIAWSIAAIAVIMPVTRSWPGVGNFGAAFCLVAFAVVLKFWSTNAFVAAAALMWVAAAARPEYLILAVVFTVIALIWIIRAIRTPGSAASSTLSTALIRVITLLIVPIILITRHGSPLAGGDRNWVAFTQHFALRTARSGEDSWIDSANIAARYFGDASSVLGALMVNPGAVLVHFLKNIVTGPIYFIGSVLPIWWREPGATRTDFVLVFIFLAVFLVLSLIALVSVRHSRPEGMARKLVSSGRFWLTSVVVLVALIPVVLIYPRIHYFGVTIGAALVGLAVIVDRYGKSPRDSVVLFTTAAGVLLVVCVTGVVGAAESLVSPPPLLTSVQALRLADPNPVLLTGDLGLQAYILGLSEVSADEATADNFGALITENKITTVLLNDRLRSSSLSTLPGFQEFLQDPSKFGFRPVAVGSEILVLAP